MVKLADFGVAMKLSEAHADDQDVVGSPYWIAPEIIEMSTPTASCDIWYFRFGNVNYDIICFSTIGA